MERNEYCFGGEKEGDSKRRMHSIGVFGEKECLHVT